MDGEIQEKFYWLKTNPKNWYTGGSFKKEIFRQNNEQTNHPFHTIPLPLIKFVLFTV